MTTMWKGVIPLLIVLLPIAANAQNTSDTFTDREDGAKWHTSGFVCPQRIGEFERDAAGEAEPQRQEDFCAYSALDGVYGTISLEPLSGSYDPKAEFADEFREQEATGGKRLVETSVKLNGLPLSIYTRTYSTARAEALDYRIVFAGAAVKNWVVQATVEYADPRDTQTEAEFLRAVYAAAEKQIGSR
ncbi:MAG: hypothetical protein JOY77_07670 [Alphaproteobacteria bacterium]|nr:hypothetical protein [Alphaproteobacteria bacterium]MBV9062794.1 hypothetical protein [Alphaproteobacteria bacterium]